MKNAGLAGAIALVGIGLMMIGLGNFVKAPSAMAYSPTVTSAIQDSGERTIVWYDAQTLNSFQSGYFYQVIYRAWSDGTIEARFQKFYSQFTQCEVEELFCQGWIILSSPTDGLNAAADINFDEMVDGQDLATLLASWGPAPRNPMPPSDCPLGLMN